MDNILLGSYAALGDGRESSMTSRCTHPKARLHEANLIGQLRSPALTRRLFLFTVTKQNTSCVFYKCSALYNTNKYIIYLNEGRPKANPCKTPLAIAPTQCM